MFFLIMREIKAPEFHLCSHPAFIFRVDQICIFRTHGSTNISICLSYPPHQRRQIVKLRRDRYLFNPHMQKDHCQSSVLTFSPCINQMPSTTRNNE